MTDEKKDEEKRLTPKDYWMSDSFGEMRRLLDSFRANMEETLERVFPSQASLPALKQPRVDILDLGNALQVVADMPGVRKETLNSISSLNGWRSALNRAPKPNARRRTIRTVSAAMHRTGV